MNRTTAIGGPRLVLRRDLRLPRTRRGNFVRLICFLIAAAVLGHLQSSRPAGTMFVQQGIAAVTMPAIAALSSAADGLHSAAETLPRARALTAENRELKSEIARLRRRTVALEDAALERNRLRAMLGLNPRANPRWVAATVIGRELTQWPSAIVIDRGRADGVQPSQPVIAAAGLVGRVYSASAHSAVVLPLADRNSSAGAMIQRSRAAGILVGEGASCRLDYLQLAADVKPGDVVISSGLGGVFPKGIMIGKVGSVARNEVTAVKTAVVRPCVDLFRLEEVLVMRR